MSVADNAAMRSTILPAGGVAPNADPGLVSTFDALDASGRGWYLGETNDRASRLAWGESYVMVAYLTMYEATGQRRYLDKFVKHATAVVAKTDRNRHVTDYRGRSTGAWRCGNTHTVAKVTFVDRRGRPVLEAFSRWFNVNNYSRIRVLAGGSRYTFSLVGRNPWVQPEGYYGLSMNARRGNYAGRRINPRSEFLTVRRVGYGVRHPKAVPRATRFRQPVPMYYHFLCQTGMTAYPLAHFYNIVKSDATLTASYEETATRFLAVAKLAVAAHDDEWVNSGRVGYYRFRLRAPVWSDGVEAPHNKLFAMGRTLVELYRATGESVYRSRSIRLARLFRRHVRRNAYNAYLWRYWWGRGNTGWRAGRSPSTWTPVYDNVVPRPEDLVHGGIDVEFAAEAARSRIVFTQSDLVRFTNTLYANMRRPGDSLAFYVDGTANEGTFASRMGITGWFSLAPVSRDLYRVANKRVANALRKRLKSGVLLYAVARDVQARRLLAADSRALRAPAVRVLGGLRQGSRVRGRFTLRLSVACAGRARVVFYVGSRRVRVLTRAPYRCRFNTRGLSNGRHLFRVVATESEGRTSVARLTLRVAN